VSMPKRKDMIIKLPEMVIIGGILP
jgi:hypothetical protein